MKKTLLLFFLISIFSQDLNAQISGFWGVSSNGGEDDGTVFKTDLNGNNAVAVYNFSDTLDYYCGDGLTDLLFFGNGIVYGLAGGGKYNAGVLFEYNTITGAYAKKFDFDVNSGMYPYSIVKGMNNKIYGAATGGGANSNGGTFFEFDPATGVFTKKFDFIPAQGCIPVGNLLVAPNGKIYGTTRDVNNTREAKMFSYDPSSGTFTTLGSLTNATNLKIPEGITLLNDTTIIGVTSGSFISSSSAFLYRYNINSSTYSDVYNFPAVSVQNARTPLVRANDGYLYGLTADGGTYGKGTLYQYDANTNTAVIKINFNGSGNGETPKYLFAATNNMIYGGTLEGGVNLGGVVFKYVPGAATVTKLREYGNNMDSQAGRMIETGNGKIISGTGIGTNNKGKVNEFDMLTNAYRVLFNFGASSGHTPVAGLVQGNNGLFYGVTITGKETGKTGVIFEFNPYTGIYTKKIELGDYGIRGSASALTLTSRGSFYGISGSTVSAGPHSTGTIYEYFPATNSLTVVYDFIGYDRPPAGELTLAANGKYYGVSAGRNIFELDPATNTVTVKYTFLDSSPYGKLLLAGNNKLYGITTLGGVGKEGSLFEYDPLTNIYTTKVDFVSASKGAHPMCDLIEYASGRIYGTTKSGGANSKGVIFEYNYLTNTFTVKHNFTSAVIGTSHSEGALLKASNGKIYGLTVETISAIAQRILYEFNPGTSVITSKLNFTGDVGLYLEHPELLEVPLLQKPAYTYFGRDTISACQGNNLILRLNSPNTTSYKWFHNNVLEPTRVSDSLWFPTASVADTGSWYCKLCNANDSSTTPEVYIRIFALPAAVINSLATTACDGNVITLSAEPESSYLWSDNSTTQSINVTAAGNYSVTVTDANGCPATSSAVTINFLPVYTVNNPQVICPGGAYAFNGHTYTAAGNYNDTLQSISGCDSIIVTQLGLYPQPLASVSANGPVTFCEGDSVTLTAGSANGYLWSTGETSQSIIAGVSGNYSVTVTDANACTASSSPLNVTVNPLPPQPSVTGDGTLLTSGSAQGNQWYYNGVIIPGATSQTYTASSNGSYTVVVTIDNCSSETSAPFVLNSVGVNGMESAYSFVVYPNPNEGTFNITLNTPVASAYTIELFDMLGQLVFKEELPAFSGVYNKEVALPEFRKGVYTISVTGVEGKTLRKVTVY